MSLSDLARTRMQQYFNMVAQANGVSSAERQFTVAPAMEQRLEQAVQQSSSFLQMINMMPVLRETGAAIYAGVNTTIAGRTDTAAGNERNPRDVHHLSSGTYSCYKTEYDTALRYETIDSWAHLPNMAEMIGKQIVSQTARDRIMIGWNGVMRAATTNRVANPKLQDVNKGWIQRYRDDSPNRVLSGANGQQYIQVGGMGAHYETIDALVYQVSREMIDESLLEDPTIRVMVGRSTLDEKFFPLINSANVPTEQNAMDVLYSSKKLGGYPVVQVPFMPAGTMMIAPPKNLSVYWQVGSRRRNIVDEPRLDRYANYESMNEDFVVERYEAGCVIQNVVFGEQTQQGGGN